MTRTLALLCVALLAAMPATLRAQELGRLFLTPEQRATLDARRKARVPDKPAAAPAVIAPITRIDGYVQRSGGKSTIWVNGEAQAEGRTRDGVRIQRGRSGDTAVAVPLGEESTSTQARVGQSVDMSTGQIRDPLGDGEIRVRRPTPSQQ